VPVQGLADDAADTSTKPVHELPVTGPQLQSLQRRRSFAPPYETERFV
jgi:hypothetical protein